MTSPGNAKCPCQHCGQHLEFPLALLGQTIDCPQCRQPTPLTVDPALSPTSPRDLPAPDPTPDLPPPAAAPSLAPTVEQVVAALRAPIRRRRPGLLYQLGLLVVACATVLLPLVYLAIVGGLAWFVGWWALHGTFLFRSPVGVRGRVMLGVLYVLSLLAGVVVVFFLIKPLLARRPPGAQPLALNPEAEPVLFAFIARICEVIGAPFPSRIDLDCDLNASAAFRRGFRSLLSNDLVLTIGLPLVAGLDARQLAGIIAHEFGHFTQGFGMRLAYVIRRVNAWFARVIYQRDTWDLWLDEMENNAEESSAWIFVFIAKTGVGLSRLVLRLLMWTGHGLGCFLLRQMEYDADTCEIRLVGSRAFEQTTQRINLLGVALQTAYKEIRVGWNLNRHLPDSIPATLLVHDAKLSPARRTELEDRLGLRQTGLFDTHPSDGDRIRRARQAAETGCFELDVPATALFSNFEAVARQVTLVHYQDELGIDLRMAKLMPVS